MTISIVTGVAGFIGSHLAEALLKQGQQVLGVDEINDYYDPSFKHRNLEELKPYANFQFIQADMASLDWQALLEGVEVVYHQAAQAGVRASWGAGFQHYLHRNLHATQVLLEAAREAKNLKKLVFASSSSVYGDAETMPTSEAICPNPVSPYGITKLAGEQLCLLYYRNFGVPVSGLRYFTVYGPRQRPDMAFHKFLRAILKGEPISIYGDGQQTRDFTFIQDAVEANLAAGRVPEAAGEVFNVGGGSRVVLTEVIDTMEKISGMPVHRTYIERAPGDARHTSADVSKAQRLLGYQPQISLEEGLGQEWQWVKSVYGG